MPCQTNTINRTVTQLIRAAALVMLLFAAACSSSSPVAEPAAPAAVADEAAPEAVPVSTTNRAPRLPVATETQGTTAEATPAQQESIPTSPAAEEPTPDPEPEPDPDPEQDPDGDPAEDPDPRLPTTLAESAGTLNRAPKIDLLSAEADGHTVRVNVQASDADGDVLQIRVRWSDGTMETVSRSGFAGPMARWRPSTVQLRLFVESSAPMYLTEWRPSRSVTSTPRSTKRLSSSMLLPSKRLRSAT